MTFLCRDNKMYNVPYNYWPAAECGGLHGKGLLEMDHGMKATVHIVIVIMLLSSRLKQNHCLHGIFLAIALLPQLYCSSFPDHKGLCLLLNLCPSMLKIMQYNKGTEVSS